MTTFIDTAATGPDDGFSTYHKTPFKSAMNGMIGLITAYVQYRRDQHDYVRLSWMSDRDFADMGITRSYIKEVKAAPFIWPRSVC